MKNTELCPTLTFVTNPISLPIFNQSCLETDCFCLEDKSKADTNYFRVGKTVSRWMNCSPCNLYLSCTNYFLVGNCQWMSCSSSSLYFCALLSIKKGTNYFLAGKLLVDELLIHVVCIFVPFYRLKKAQTTFS